MGAGAPQIIMPTRLRAAAAHAILGRTPRSRRIPFIAGLLLLHISPVRRLATFCALLAAGGTLACYQEKPAAHTDSTRSGAASAVELQPVPASHDTAIREIDRFALTTDGLQRLAAAKRNVSALYTRDPGVDARMRGGIAPKNLDEMVARIEGEPGMRSALQQAGLSARDYMISMVALQQAVKGYQLKQSGKLDASRVPPVVMANINFVGAHMPEIMQTMMASGARTPPTR